MQGEELTSVKDGEWFPISLFSLQITRFCGIKRGSEVLNSPTLVRNHRSGSPTFSLVTPPRSAVLDSVDEYCVNNPGCVRQIGGLGARKASKKSLRFLKHPAEAVWIGDSSGACMFAALFNGIHELKGEQLGLSLIQQAPMPTARDLKDLVKYTEGTLGKFSSPE